MKKSLMYESEKKQSNWNSFGDSTSSHKTLGFKQYRADSICVYMPYLRFDLTENGIWLTSRDSLLQDIYIYIYIWLKDSLYFWRNEEKKNQRPTTAMGKNNFLLSYYILFVWVAVWKNIPNLSWISIQPNLHRNSYPAPVSCGCSFSLDLSIVQWIQKKRSWRKFIKNMYQYL